MSVGMDEAAWLTCALPEDMLAYLARCGPVSERKSRLFACAVCRHIWHLLSDERSRAAVEVAERYADGLAGDRELLDAHFRAEDVAPPYVSAPWAATLAASDRPDRARTVSRDAVAARRGEGAAAAEGDAHCRLLRCVFGNPFCRIALDPALRTPTVLSLARATYEERHLPTGHLDPARLAVLADALEEAGGEVLAHLRGPGPHVRGCHVLDRLTGRA